MVVYDLVRRGLDRTYGDSGCLCQESNEVETQFSVRRKRHTSRDHENNYSEFLSGPEGGTPKI